MELTYIKVFLDWREATKRLKDAEKGRLIDAMVAYANGEDPDPILSGNEQYSFENFRLQIDRDRAEVSDSTRKRSRAGSLGNEARWGRKSSQCDKCDEENRKISQCDKCDEENRKISQCDKCDEESRKHRYDKDKDKDKDKGGGSENQDTLELYATNAFPHMTVNEIREMESYIGEMEESLIRYAIDLTKERGVSRFAYCRKILNDFAADDIHTVEQAKAAKENVKSAKPAPAPVPDDNPIHQTKFY